MIDLLRRYLVLVSLLIAVCTPVFTQNLPVQWTRQYGTSRIDEAFGVAYTTNAVYIVGETFGAFSGATNAGAKDAFVSKLDPLGNLIWTRQFGTSVEDTATAAAADASGVYVVGFTAGGLQGANAGATDAFVRKYDPNGNVLWTKQFGLTTVDQASAAVVDSTGLYVTGWVNGILPGQTSTGLSGDDVFLRKYDFNGTEIWTRQFGTGDQDRGYGVALDATGVYVTGSSNGAFVANSGGTDALVRKYTTDGTVVWSRQFGTAGTDTAYGVAVGASGVYVSGETTGTFTGQTKTGGLYDAWARKLDLSGNDVWTRQFGTVYEDSGAGVVISQNWVYVAVNSSSWELVLKRFDFNGADTGSLSVTPDRKFGHGVATDGAGVYLTLSKDGTSLGQTPQGDLDATALRVPNPPLISGISDAFTGQPGVAPTTWTSLYGTNLAAGLNTWNSSIQGNQLPKSIDGVSVLINNRPATIHFVSAGQVNVLAPLDDTVGNVQVTLTNAYGTSAPVTLAETAVLPAFYAPFGEAKGLFVTAVALDGTLLGKPGLDPRVPRPLRPGEVVQFYATGFGKTNPAAASDLVFSGAPEVIAKPRITIGGREASIFGNGNLVAPGLYQFNLTVPDLTDGEYVIQAEIGTARSLATVFVAVKK